MRSLIFLSLMLLPVCAMAENGVWNSTVTGGPVAYTISAALSEPAKDYNGKNMTIVYLENLSCEKVGQNSNAEDVEWLRQQGYQVIEINYAKHEKAVSPYINQDIIAINQALKNGAFGDCQCSEYRSYVLMEGYRIKRNISYYHDDPTVYNFPDVYKDSQGDSLYFDLVYPANPVAPVPVLVTFSYSNSFATNESGALTTKNQHKRMYMPYFWGGFNDSFVEGASVLGFAWAVCDHPKYCDWGQGKYTGGANKSLGAIEVNPDAARKVKSAIRTVRGLGSSYGLNGVVAVTGFSRGSTAASLAVGDKADEALDDALRGLYPAESSSVSCALLGPGVFDYSIMTNSSREYKNMSSYVTAFPSFGWAMQGAVGNISTKVSAPCLFYYNSDDDANYKTCAQAMKSLLDSLGIETELLVDYGTGHSVPQSTAHLMQMYDFLLRNTKTKSQIEGVKGQSKVHSMLFDLNGRVKDEYTEGFLIESGKTILREQH